MSHDLSDVENVPLQRSDEGTSASRYGESLFELPAPLHKSLAQDRVVATEFSLALLKTTAGALDLSIERVREERGKILLANLQAPLLPPAAPPYRGKGGWGSLRKRAIEAALIGLLAKLTCCFLVICFSRTQCMRSSAKRKRAGDTEDVVSVEKLFLAGPCITSTLTKSHSEGEPWESGPRRKRSEEAAVCRLFPENHDGVVRTHDLGGRDAQDKTGHGEGTKFIATNPPPA
eukprot:gene11287-7822_t